jgi:hypothetical protein
MGLVVLAAACAAGSNVQNPFDGSVEQAQADRLRIQVQNLNFNDVTVFAVSSGQRVRLGTVTGKTDGSYTISWNYANPIQFEVDMIGGNGCATPPIAVDRGARVWLQVPGELSTTPCRSGRT